MEAEGERASDKVFTCRNDRFRLAVGLAFYVSAMGAGPI